ncbi:hypothetical protein ABW21_db0205987 [Orbilia brochopaga]|nr:hypothetical protein ABW21_db0205987 [Drechslerella brochopaga]
MGRRDRGFTSCVSAIARVRSRRRLYSAFVGVLDDAVAEASLATVCDVVCADLNKKSMSMPQSAGWYFSVASALHLSEQNMTSSQLSQEMVFVGSSEPLQQSQRGSKRRLFTVRMLLSLKT